MKTMLDRTPVNSSKEIVTRESPQCVTLEHYGLYSSVYNLKLENNELNHTERKDDDKVRNILQNEEPENNEIINKPAGSVAQDESRSIPPNEEAKNNKSLNAGPVVLRRSKRKRYQPLRFWLNEHFRYKRDACNYKQIRSDLQSSNSLRGFELPIVEEVNCITTPQKRSRKRSLT
jgi:hypothetical protein